MPPDYLLERRHVSKAVLREEKSYFRKLRRVRLTSRRDRLALAFRFLMFDLSGGALVWKVGSMQPTKAASCRH